MKIRGQKERAEERKAYIALRRAVRAAGIRVSFADADKDGNYATLRQNHIVLRKGMSLRETLYVLAHEFGHVQSKLGNFTHVHQVFKDLRQSQDNKKGGKLRRK